MKKVAVLCFALLAFAAIFYFVDASRRSAPLDRLFQVGEFQLTTQAGTPFNSSSLQGKVWIADFIFTHCPTICPTLTEKMSALTRTFAREPNVRFISISIDPVADTPAVLAEYARTRHLDLSRWTLLTGPQDAIIHTIVNGFHQPVGERIPRTINREIYDMLHSGRFTLVDQHGIARGLYETDPEGLEQLEHDVNTLLETEGNQ
ncbi:MAG: SCO family protein [Sandaracinaceae bacterium]|jgi:protein SCO1/2|nr:SCO family protein [Sandaracinaceae bacterium]